MENSRTSNSKRVVKKPIKKVSASPSSSNKKVVKKNIPNSKKVQAQRAPSRVNNRNPNNNIRLKDKDAELEYVPFFDGDNNQEIITPNVIGKIEPKRIVKNDIKDSSGRKNISKAILKFTLFIALISVAIYLAFSLEVFNIDDITISGNEKYSSDEILRNIKLKKGENIFKEMLFSSKDIELPYVSKADFNIVLPNKIVVNVKERYPAYIALDRNTSKYYKIDNDGFLLEECKIESKKDELVIEGFVFEENIKLGDKISEVYLNKLEIYNNIKEMIQKYEIQGNITKVNFSTSLTTISLDDKLNITFSNDSNLEYKVSFLKGIINKNGNNLEGYIDMSIENPVYSKYD